MIRHPSYNGCRSGFTLLEVLAVMVILALLLGITLSAVNGLTGAHALSVAGRQVSNLMTVARSEALARHKLVRFTVATENSSGNIKPYCRISLWEWHAESESFVQFSEWESLPEGIVFDPEWPGYINNSSYAAREPSLVRGDYPLAMPEAHFQAEAAGSPIKLAFIEFLPSGIARLPGGAQRQLLLVLCEGSVETTGDNVSITYQNPGQAPANWAQVTIDTLTGRSRLHRP